MKKSLSKKLISSITATLMAASYILPAVPEIPTRAAALSDEEKVTLLVGDNSDIRGKDLETTIRNAENKYALGIASQFGVFLNGDFYDDGADSEGRTAARGTINKSGVNGFDVGSGDYLDKFTLESLLGSKGFAHVIAGNIQNLSPYSNDMYSNKGESDKFFNPKIFAYSTEGSINMESISGVPASPEQIKGALQVHQVDLIDFDAVYEMLGSRSKLLSEQQTPGTSFSADTTKQTIIPYFYQYHYADKGGEETERPLTGEAVFLYEGSETDTIKFNLTKEEWEQACACQYFSFRGIPEEADIVISVAGKNIDMVQYGAGASYTLDRFTGISPNVDGSEEQSISKGYYTYDSDGNVHGKYNNDEGTNRVLYNFYEAEYIGLESAFQGTILAPYATFKGSGYAHLSGALVVGSIAEGNAFEFGYRPYQGSIDVLGLKADYAVDISKFAEDGKTLLPGAKIGLFEVNEDGSIGSMVEEIVTTGGTDKMYMGSGNYALMETAPPAGYKRTDKI